jgi:hypothetical protein
LYQRISSFLAAAWLCHRLSWIDQARVVTYSLGKPEPESDGGVGEGHDRRDDGDPRHVVDVGYKGQHQLGGSEEQHVQALAAV